MSDYNVDKEFNLLDSTPALSKVVFDQEACNCCWAICVATVIGYLYYAETEEPNFELSPQDILDRVGRYYNYSVRHNKRDTAGCYRCNTHLAYKYVKHFGVGFLNNYPFLKVLNEDKEAINPKTEFPRVFTGDHVEYTDIQGVIKSLKENKQAVIGAIEVTRQFADYKKKDGIYRNPVADQVAGDATTPSRVFKFGKHAVVIVGVNEEEGYFIIRNSWGPEWGDNGYRRVAYDVFLPRFSAPTSAYLHNYPLN